LNFLSDWPESGDSVDEGSPELAGVRIWQVDGFPNFLVVFRVKRDHIDVLHLTRARVILRLCCVNRGDEMGLTASMP
jgi:hypothetical protein